MVQGQYAPGSRGFLLTTEIDLTQATSAELRFNQYFDTDGVDGGRVIVSPDGGNTYYLVRTDGGYLSAAVFNPGEGFAGFSQGWLATTVDLSAFIGERIVIGFDFASDGVDERAGWFIDDIEVVGQ
jgi:bacillopeptidase F (M6 metalloprotease family)